jgi:hypothetical protein
MHIDEDDEDEDESELIQTARFTRVETSVRSISGESGISLFILSASGPCLWSGDVLTCRTTGTSQPVDNGNAEGVGDQDRRAQVWRGPGDRRIWLSVQCVPSPPFAS